MDPELLAKMSLITEEERRILDSGSVDQSLYTDTPYFMVDSKKMLEQGKLITVRAHTRFVEFPKHKHNYVEMMYVCQGIIVHEIDGETVCMRPGDLLLINQHAMHSIHYTGKEDIGINFIVQPAFFDSALLMLDRENFISDFLIDVLRSDTKGEFLHFGTKGILQIENIIENMIYSIAYHQDEDRINQVLMGVLFQYLLKYMTALNRSTKLDYRDLLLRSAKDYIEHNYRCASLQELAKLTNQSISGLSRLIKEKSGYTFKELLKQKRFQVAADFLSNTDLPINDIIAIVGYENSSYFYQQFHEKYGLSPQTYRNQYRNQEHNPS